MKPVNTINRYSSRKGDVTVSRSLHHEGMWIVNFSDGGFFSVTTEMEQIMKAYPPDDKKLLIHNN